KMMARFAKLGIGPRAKFDPQALSPEMLQAVQDGMADAWAAFKEYKETQIEGRGHLSGLFHRRCEPAAERGERVRAAFCAGPAPSGQRLLVANALRVAFEPSLSKSAEPLSDQFAHAAKPQARC